jgi:hypothetical protein
VFENTGQTSTGNGRPWVAVDEYDINAWWVNSFSVNRTTKSETKNYNLELKYDNGGNFTSEVRAIRANGDRLSMNGQAQGDLSNWQYAPGRFNLFRDAADRTRGPFYPAAICAQYPASQRTNAVVGSAGGCYLAPNPLGYGANPQLHYNIGGNKAVWSGFDNPLAGGLGAGKTLKDYMANKDSYAIAAFSSEGNNEVESDMNVFRAEGHYKFDDKFLGFITKIDAGVRQSDRSVAVEAFHLFSPFYGGTPGAVQTQRHAGAGRGLLRPVEGHRRRHEPEPVPGGRVVELAYNGLPPARPANVRVRPANPRSHPDLLPGLHRQPSDQDRRLQQRHLDGRPGQHHPGHPGLLGRRSA